MLEESISMDKKNVNARSNTGPVKTNVLEAKNKQDNNQNGKLYRNAKKRESSIPHSRPENFKKPIPQKSKALDKRPRVRGYYNERSRSEIAEDYLRAEYGSAQMQGSKKINVNHLLNFTLAPRNSDGNTASQSCLWKFRNKWGIRKTHFNKEQFLQANCQFVVRDSENYAVHAIDPDVLVDWEFIEQVRTFSHEIPSCPICLYPPKVAKITRCGHIYCWTCIIHYLALTDNSWRKCPICYEAVHKNDLKSVMAIKTHQFTVGEKITMQLMKKQKGSVFATPKNQWTERNEQPYRLDDHVSTTFVKLLVATSDYSQQIIDTERNILEIELKEEYNEPECCFIEAALEELKEREKILHTRSEVDSSLELTVKDDVISNVETIKHEESSKMVVYNCAFSDEEQLTFCALDSYGYHNDSESDFSQEMVASNNLCTEQLVSEIISDTITESKNSVKTNHYFYQASDGQHIYLHGLNVRCLLKEYGEWEHCPDTITATVVELESISITKELRNRLRYLAHLPLTCEVKVAELKLEPPVVSLHNLQFFHDEIQRRKQARTKKNRDEQRWEKQLEVKVKKRMGYVPSETFSHYSSLPDDEICENFLDNSPPLPNYSKTIPAVHNPVLNIDHLSPHSEDSQFPSFAQLLKDGKAKAEVWPKAVLKPQAAIRVIETDGSDSDDYAPARNYQQTFGDVIQVAFDNLSLNKDDSQTGQKKKKNKKKLLFSTTMACTK